MCSKNGTEVQQRLSREELSKSNLKQRRIEEAATEEGLWLRGMMTDLFGLEVYKVINDIVAQVLVNDPVHELEARECHWEKYTAVLVNV